MFEVAKKPGNNMLTHPRRTQPVCNHASRARGVNSGRSGLSLYNLDHTSGSLVVLIRLSVLQRRFQVSPEREFIAPQQLIGISFQILKDTIMILEVIPSGPSEKVGLRAGDKIIKANDTILAGTKLDNERVVKNLRGAKGTKVKIGVISKSSTALFATRILPSLSMVKAPPVFPFSIEKVRDCPEYGS